MNSNDPLSQLRDIHLPPDIGFWPLAPGWWVVIALLIIATGLAIYALLSKQYQRRNQYRKAATSLLETYWQQYQSSDNASQYLGDLTQLLRRTAIRAYPDLPLQSLSGENWLRFLDACSKGKRDFCEGAGKAILTLPYQAQVDGDIQALHHCVATWIKEHQHVPTQQTVDQIFSNANAGVEDSTREHASSTNLPPHKAGSHA